MKQEPKTGALAMENGPCRVAADSEAEISAETIEKAHRGVTDLIGNIKTVMYIETKKLEYIIAAKIAGGHVILADFHGVGKTSLARALAGSIQWHSEDMFADAVKVDCYNRIQCTVDLLPQDILGYNRILGVSQDMVFNKGPIFTHFLLCDEINLLTPKTQGSFLQAMEEQAVTIEGKTYPLPDPFFIIATMNIKGIHLFPLPAPQLDRFMVQVSLGYPAHEDEASIIAQHGRDDGWQGFCPVVDSKDLIFWKTLVDKVYIHPDLIDYTVRILRGTRNHEDLSMGASPRAGVKISRLARALALIRGEDYVSVDLMKEIMVPCLAHRIEAADPSIQTRLVVEELLRQVSVGS